jgi:hypothetical protein
MGQTAGFAAGSWIVRQTPRQARENPLQGTCSPELACSFFYPMIQGMSNAKPGWIIVRGAVPFND